MSTAELRPVPREPAPGPAECAHCGLPVPAASAGHEPAFCCAGCEAAWHVLHGSGLERYYDLPERRGAPVRASGRAYREFDHEAFHALHVRPTRDGLRTTELYLEGVHCASCVWLIERTPRVVRGLARAELDVGRRVVRVAWDPARVTLSEIARALDSLGYRPHPFRGLKAEERRRAEDRALLARIGVAGALAGNVMLAALALYSGWFGDMAPEVTRYFRWVSLILVTPVLVWAGQGFFRGAWGALRTRSLHMDLPVALALTAGYLQGAFNTVADRGPVYFDSVATLVFLLLVGRFLQQRAQRAAADSAELMHSLAPASARVIEDGEPREVPLEALLPGMALEVRPGDTVGADGVVVEGRSHLDRSLLSGESRPVPVGVGERVYAGTVNRESRLVVRVEQVGEESRLGHILREVERGAARRAPVVRLADRLAGAFVGAVLALSAITWLVWMGLDPPVALDHAIALLIVTCPCALALATPLAVSVAVGRAARSGVLVKSGDALERLARPGTLVLDKTGTLTEGRTALVAWDGPEWARPLVLALERHATHPIAAGFAEAWEGVAPAEAAEVRHTLGGGIEGTVSGRRVAVGSPAFVGARIGAAGARPAGAPAGGAAAGQPFTPAWVAVDGALVARAGFGDRVRPGARAALDALRARGWRLRLLSGDAPEVARAVGRGLGFAESEITGGASPEDKLAAIERLERGRRVVMVGDGVNDAAAIARATVGVAVRGGAEASLAAADVYLAGGGIAPLAALVRGAERTLSVIRRGLAFSLVYNLAGASLAMAGLVNPILAAVLMPMSSLTVVIAAWRSRTFGGPA